jgi:hypothetical protein
MPYYFCFAEKKIPIVRVAQLCDSSTQEAEEGEPQFEASLGYIMSSRPVLANSKPCFKQPNKKSSCWVSPKQ